MSENLINKKILFLVSSMEGGGAERVASLLCNFFVKKGYEVVLMPTFSGRGECAYPIDSRIDITYLADLVTIKRRSVRTMIKRFLVLRNFIKKKSPDYIISFLPIINIVAVLATIGTKIPVIISERNYPPMQRLNYILEMLRKWSYGKARMVVMQTERGKSWLQSISLKSCCTVIPNPIEFPLPDNHGQVVHPDNVVFPERMVLLSVGRLVDQKGFDRLIRIFSRLSKEYVNLSLVILGEGEKRSFLERLICENKLSGVVHMPGRVGNLSDWYKRSSLFVLSSRFEGFPNALLEAMAHGVSVVSMDCATGPEEIIDHNVNGMLVPEDDEQSLESTLKELLADREKRQMFAAESIHVRKKYSIERIGDKWIEMLRDSEWKHNN